MSKELIGMITHIEIDSLDVSELGEEPGTQLIPQVPRVAVAVRWLDGLPLPEVGSKVVVIVDD